jgi:hypothetical protein
MQNGTNLSAEMLNSLFQMMKKGKDGQDSVRNILNQSLNDSQKQAVSQIMSDPQKMKELLSSPQAQELLRKFGGNSQGENKNGSA